VQNERDVWNITFYDRVNWSKIGEALCARYDPSQPLPYKIRMLLVQLGEPTTERLARGGVPVIARAMVIPFTHPGVSQLQHKRPHFVFHKLRNVLAADSIIIRDGVEVAMSVTPRERPAGLAGARLRPTPSVLECARSN
jgi:hypothetical protein